MERTIFHKIIDREIPADIVHEDDAVLAFKDIRPQDATHVLFVPKEFVLSVADCTGDKAHVPGMLIDRARSFAAKKGLTGYSLKFNVGKHGGQEVPYLHLHLTSPQALGE